MKTIKIIIDNQETIISYNIDNANDLFIKSIFVKNDVLIEFADLSTEQQLEVVSKIAKKEGNV